MYVAQQRPIPRLRIRHLQWACCDTGRINRVTRDVSQEAAQWQTHLCPEIVEEHCGQISLPKGWQDHHDQLALVLWSLGNPVQPAKHHQMRPKTLWQAHCMRADRWAGRSSFVLPCVTGLAVFPCLISAACKHKCRSSIQRCMLPLACPYSRPLPSPLVPWHAAHSSLTTTELQ